MTASRPNHRMRMTTLPRSILLVLLLGYMVRPLDAQDRALFAQTASATLEQNFSDPALSWLLLDRSGGILAQHWTHVQLPIPPGSLLKPFLAVAYGEQHEFNYPHVLCMGSQGKCWLPQGHGRLGLEQALAQSCNDYFLSLANGLDRDRAMRTFNRFELNGLPRNADDSTLMGLSDGWRETPLSIARAYWKLLDDSSQPAQARIVAGMQASAQTGTAREVDGALGAHAALAKTGTAVCTHSPRATADGFAVVLYPAEQPRMLLLLRRHGSTGAQTAAQAGAMLRSLGMGSP